jgi:hypothetical protein
MRALFSALLLPFIAASAALAQGSVTDVAIRPDPSYLQARVCPVTVAFDGYVTMDGPGTVTYQIVRSDGATSAVYSLDFAEPGTQSLRETWTLGDAAALPHVEGWVAIRVLTPNEVESSHAEATFIMTCGVAPPQQPPPTPQRARFRVSLTGFSCLRETADHDWEIDGPRDEIYQAPYVLIVDRSGATTTYRSGAHGPVFGRISTGTRFPSSTPSILSGTPIGLGIPGVLFEGELIEGEKAVAIAPTLWEWDGDHRQLSGFFGACTAARAEIASLLVPIMTGPSGERYGGLRRLFGLIDAPIRPEWGLDRPIGVRRFWSAWAFSPTFLLLTYEEAMLAAGGASLGLDTFAIEYEEPNGPNGFYTLHGKIEQIP